MNITPKNLNTGGQGVHFTGAKAPSYEELRAIERFTYCGLNGLKDKFIARVKASELSGLVQKRFESFDYIPEDNFARRLSTSFKDFFGMPLDILSAIGKQFPNSRLNNAQFIQKHREAVKLDKTIKAVQGIQKSGEKYLYTLLPEGITYPTGSCTAKCQSLCNIISKEFNINLNKSMASKVADYDTKKERMATRLVSGFIAANFLHNDFYNKAIENGKSKSNAEKTARKKQGQEIKENMIEAVTQFGVFSFFSSFVNQNIWAPALLSAGIGLVSRVISRKISHMPIKRVKVPDDNPKQFISLQEFAGSAKKRANNESQEIPQNAAAQKIAKKKAPILSAKHIAQFCGLSIGVGYLLRFLKGHTEAGKKLGNKLNDYIANYENKMVEPVMADKNSLREMSQILQLGRNSRLAGTVSDCIGLIPPGEEKIEIGTKYKTTKLFGLFEARTKDLVELPITIIPIKLAKELVSYPYKLASKLENAVRGGLMKSKGIAPPSGPSPIKDKYDIKNIYLKFMELKEKYKGEPDKLATAFNECIEEGYMKAYNMSTASKGDNSKIAVLAQTFGTLTGLWFNMNDEFNASIKNGTTKAQAEKDARMRGINKFLRMSVQIIIVGSLNSMFSKQYNSSIAKSSAIVAICTLLTDTATRLLTGMPNKKMTKEEIEAQKEKHSKSGYYKAIDKLAS